VVVFLIIQQGLIRNKNNYFKNLNFSNKDRSIIKELSSNQEILKSTYALKYSGFHLERYLDKKLDIDSSISKYDAQQISTTSFFVLLSSIFTIGVGSIFVVSGDLSIGSLIGFNIFATRALGTISSVQNSFSILGKTKIYLKDCSDFFKDSKNRAEGMQLSRLIGNIKLQDINFSYSKESKYAVKNFSAIFNSSEITVLYGINGCGKTTIARLIVGLLNPESGEISIDNTNLDKLSLAWYKNNVAYIPQDVGILNSSILNNILISNPKLNEQEVSRLLQSVGLDNELKNSNLTLTDLINNNSSKGIFKKIHVARSISKNFQIYVFDDPTLYLDSDGKTMIIKLITSLKRAGKTLICFSEDKEIIGLCDKKIKLG
jgi:ATP-binding cassette subfamily C protein LapB